MQAIIPNRPAAVRPYAWGSISVTPDPPRVGAVTRISFPLANPGPGEVVVERIETRVALFGMGVRWEELPPLGPFHLPADAAAITEAALEWTPAEGGHRCVRASIYVQGAPSPLMVGRNLHVVNADAGEQNWNVGFRLGNPEHTAAPIVLRLGGDDALDAMVRIGERVRPAGRPIWLEPGEEVEAELLLRATGNGALDAIRTVEATIGGRLIDGIQVTVRRRAYVPLDLPAPWLYSPDAAVDEGALSLV